MFPVVLSVPSRNFSEAIRAIKERIRTIPNKGVGYSIGKLANRNEADVSGPDIVFNYLGQFAEAGGDGAMATSSLPLGDLIDPANALTHVQAWNGVVNEGVFELALRYDPHVIQTEEVRLLVQHFSRNLGSLIEHCLSQKTELWTPSDFSDGELTLEELEEIGANLRNLE